MVFVEYDTVPMHLLNPLVSSLDAAHAVCAEHILKRGKAHEASCEVNMVKLPVLLFLNEGPVLEVLVREQVFLPCSLYCRFERQYEYMFPSHAQGQLIGSEGLAEAHLGIPKEVGGKSLVGFVGSKRLEILGSLLYSLLLLRAHLEVQGALQECCLVVSHSFYCLHHLFCAACKPLSLWVRDVCTTEHPVYCLVAEHRTILAHGCAYEFHLPRLSGDKRRIVFFHPHFDIAGGKAHFEHTGIACVGIGVYDRPFRHLFLK